MADHEGVGHPGSRIRGCAIRLRRRYSCLDGCDRRLRRKQLSKRRGHAAETTPWFEPFQVDRFRRFAPFRPPTARRLRGAGQDAKSSKPIGKTKIEEHNCIRGRGLLQELPRNETGEVQRCEEMLAYGPTNLKIGLTPDAARATKGRRSYWHVL